MSSRGVVLRRYGLEPNSDPTTLSVSPKGGYVLVDEYQADALPDEEAINWIWIFDGHSLHKVAAYADSGSSTEIRSASW
jgi:hypothetical protein